MEDKKKPLYDTRALIIQGEKKTFEDYTPKFDEKHAKLAEEVKKIEVKDKDGDKKKEEDEKKQDFTYL